MAKEKTEKKTNWFLILGIAVGTVVGKLLMALILKG